LARSTDGERARARRDPVLAELVDYAEGRR
jgi:hypothetical protein